MAFKLADQFECHFFCAVARVKPAIVQLFFAIMASREQFLRKYSFSSRNPRFGRKQLHIPAQPHLFFVTG
jgi:hypothetical protein